MPTYDRIAAEIGAAGRVCELGVFNGESLKLWKDLFPEGLVVGVDFIPQAIWPPNTVRVVCDQASPDLPGILREHSPDGYDMIVDDGNHVPAFVEKSWNNLWCLIKPGGWYVVEDWISAGMPFQKFAPEFVDRLLEYEHLIDSIEYRHNLIIFRKQLRA